jgi:hypothetical protein
LARLDKLGHSGFEVGERGSACHIAPVAG